MGATHCGEVDLAYEGNSNKYFADLATAREDTNIFFLCITGLFVNYQMVLLKKSFKYYKRTLQKSY